MFRKLVLALVALLLATACAAESYDAAVEVRTGPAAAATLRAVPDAAADAGTARFEAVTTVSVGGHAVDLVATGAHDTDAQRMSMSMDMGAWFEQLAVATGEDLPGGLEGTMELVADGSTFYLRSPMLDMVVGNADWLSFTPEDLGVTADAFGLANLDPSTLVETLRGVTGEPVVVGVEDVRGVETTRYAATMDLAKAIEDVPADQRAQIEAQLDQLGEPEISVDVWIDAEGLPRRLQMDMGRLATMGFGEDAGAVMTTEFFDYGQPVDIEVPAAKDVTPITEVLGGPGGSLELRS
jgi:hypothetical protein